MILGLDHLAIAVHDPDAAIAELAAFLGVAAGTSGGRHRAWGTRNRLLWLGDTYVELVTVFDPQLAARSWLGAPTLQAMDRGAPEAICWAIATDDLDLDRAEMNAAGASLGPASGGERRRPDGETVRWRLALPRAVDLARPFLIEHDQSAAEWSPSDRAERAQGRARVRSLDLPVDAIEGLPEDDEEQPLGHQRVRAMGASGDLPTVVIGGLDRGGIATDVLGCHWRVE